MIDADIIVKARNADVLAFFHARYGYTFAQRGGTYRCKQHPSLVVKSDHRSWYWHSRGIGGYGVLDYLMKTENMPFRQAVETVSGMTPATPPPQSPGPPKTLTLPPKAGLPLQLYDYLCCRRGIDSQVVNTLIEQGALYQDKRGNVVFVGFDEHRKPRFASLRGAGGRFHMDCAGSDKRYGFHMTFSESAPLYIFESPIDAMSHASMTDDWKAQNRLSLAGISDVALAKHVELRPGTGWLVFCLDNDPAGREAAALMAKKYADKGYHTQIELPTGKDFNEDLQTHVRQIQAERQLKSLHRDVTI